MDSLVARLQEKADGQQQILMKQEFSEITLDIIGKVDIIMYHCIVVAAASFASFCPSLCSYISLCFVVYSVQA